MALAIRAGAVNADPAQAIERLKAAFIYKFASYTEWPGKAFDAPESPIVIGVAGSESIAAELERTVSGRKSGMRALEVRRITGPDLGPGCCHVLFVSAESAPATTAALLSQAEGQAVLSVTEARLFHPSGSVINFLEADDRVRFDISRGAAERNGLQLRSQLLAVARNVTSP